MNDEIKEINIKIPGQILDYVDTKDHLLDLFNYITNLQQENHELKSKLECYENGVYYSSKVDELEQENERLKEWNKDLLNENIELENIRKEAIEYNKEIVDNYLEEDNCEYCDGRYATAKHNLNILESKGE